MKKIILFSVWMFLTVILYAQDTTTEQQREIENEQTLLKEGKISYEEFQQRVEKIKTKKQKETKKENPINLSKEAKSAVNIDSVNSSDKNFKNQTNTLDEQNEVSEPNNAVVNTNENNQLTNDKKPVFRKKGLRPGDELIRFSKQFYTGLGVVLVGYGISFVGLVVGVATGGAAGLGLVFVGSLAGLVGTGVAIASFIHIRKAGQIMNQLDDQR